MKYDPDIAFNRGPWAKLIVSQARLFNVEALVEVSDRLRQDFHEGHLDGRKMPLVPTSAYSCEIPLGFGELVAGYDLPCLLSADREPKGTIMLCAQDPLRSGTEAGLTVGTFFGIDSQRLRHSRRHYGVLWELIRRCVAFGYDVWVTDAMKLYVKGAAIDPKLHELCGEVLLDEVNLVKPDHIVAFGKRARELLRGFGLQRHVIHHRHPTARGRSEALLVNALPAENNTPEARFNAKVQYYFKSIFCPELPPSAGVPD